MPRIGKPLQLLLLSFLRYAEILKEQIMQMNEPLLRPQGLGFQIPNLSKEIPRAATVVRTASISPVLVRNLVDAGVIHPADIPEGTCGFDSIGALGLAAWFKRRIGHLKTIQCSIGVISPHVVDDWLLGGQGERENNGEEINGPTLCIKQPSSEPIRYMERQAEILEKHCKGLFATALDLVVKASYRTIHVRHPEEMYWHFCGMNYGGDESDTYGPDAEAYIRGELVGRFGDDPALIDSYMPEKTRPIFGVQHWSHYSESGCSVKKLTRRQLARAARPWKRKPNSKGKTRQHELVRAVAREVLKLHSALTTAKKSRASLPDLHQFDFDGFTFSACSLQYSDHTFTTDTLDTIQNDHMNNGGNDEFLGLAQLPSNPDEMCRYFAKMDAAFALLGQMDKVISLISQKPKQTN